MIRDFGLLMEGILHYAGDQIPQQYLHLVQLCKNNLVDFSLLSILLDLLQQELAPKATDNNNTNSNNTDNSNPNKPLKNLTAEELEMAIDETIDLLVYRPNLNKGADPMSRFQRKVAPKMLADLSGQKEDARIVPILISCLTDEDEPVRMSCKESLQKMKVPFEAIYKFYSSSSNSSNNNNNNSNDNNNNNNNNSNNEEDKNRIYRDMVNDLFASDGPARRKAVRMYYHEIDDDQRTEFLRGVLLPLFYSKNEKQEEAAALVVGELGSKLAEDSRAINALANCFFTQGMKLMSIYQSIYPSLSN